jgi:hypothetical protein
MSKNCTVRNKINKKKKSWTSRMKNLAVRYMTDLLLLLSISLNLKPRL